MIARLRRLLKDERVRFVIAGGINTLVGYSLFALLQFAIGHLTGYIATLLISHVLASIVAFNLYRHFVFSVTGNSVVDFLRFQTVYILPLAINLAVLPVLVELLHWNVYLAQAIVVIVSTTISYLGHKFFSFRRTAIAEAIEAPADPDDVDKDTE
jgi:putative flippase GtrA